MTENPDREGTQTMSAPERTPDAHRPLNSLDEWEDFLKDRYPPPAASRFTDPDKKKETFRDQTGAVRPTVREFYRLNHRHQTLDFVRQKQREYLSLSKRRMGVWESM
jgi:inositol oxygenase